MFANRIKYLRVSRNMNQVQLAEKLCVTKQSVSNWENNNIMPSVEMLEKAADFFGVTTDYLLGREENNIPGGLTLDVTGLTRKQIEHIRQIVEDFRDL